MKSAIISKVEIYKMSIPIDPFTISLGTQYSAENTLIKVYTTDGLYGVGEGSSVSFITGETQAMAIEAAKVIAKLIVGKSALEIGPRLKEIQTYLARTSTIISAFDMAFYDLLGKYADMPLWQVLGGPKRRFSTSNTLGIDSPKAMAKGAKKFVKEGWTTIKVKLGENKKNDIERIRLIREAVGPNVVIRVDANQGWDTPTALAILNEIVKYDVQYCEEPVPYWNNKDLKRIREKSPIPIMADETVFNHHDAFRIASMEAADYINIKLSKSGGIYNALMINSIAEAAGIKCMLGCMMESRLALTANAHLVSARPNIMYADLDGSEFHKVDPVIGGVKYEKGEVILPDGVGIGADIDEAFLKGLERTVIE